MKVVINTKPPEVGYFVNYLLSLTGYAHFQHLVEKSYARHVILDELYKGLPELIDVFAEASISLQCKLEYDCLYMGGMSIESCLEGLLNQARALHYKIAKYTGLTNALEQIQTFIMQILYKLQNLK